MEIEFDFSKTDLGDWPLVMRCIQSISPEDFPEWIAFLDRVIVGGKQSIPMIALREASKKFFDALAEASNPKASAV